MSKAVLVSIRPKWCELIASGKKTIEVRKTRPKMETPFKCYIYCTKPSYEYEDFIPLENGRFIFGGGKVIGEFVCDEVSRYAKYGYRLVPSRYMKSSPGGYPATEIHFHSLQLSPDDLEQYGKGAKLYGWHISDLKIYDDPMELSEFMKPCNPDPDGLPLCLQCKRLAENYGCGGKILRPPQSWCFVEELG